MTLALAACRDVGTAVNDVPTYEVRGTVRTSAGRTVPGALVEVHTYGSAGCGQAPFLAYQAVRADEKGRYRIRQDAPGDGLNRCLRILAYADGSALSTPGSPMDLAIDRVRVVQAAVFTVDLTAP